MLEEKLNKYAENLEFEMNKEEYKTLANEFEILFKQVDLIGNIEGIEEFEPLDFPFPLDKSTSVCNFNAVSPVVLFTISDINFPIVCFDFSTISILLTFSEYTNKTPLITANKIIKTKITFITFFLMVLTSLFLYFLETQFFTI